MARDLAGEEEKEVAGEEEKEEEGDQGCIRDI
jgi:hypothetical protein